MRWRGEHPAYLVPSCSIAPTMSEFSKEIQISIEVAAELFTSLIFKTYQGVAGFVKDKNKEHDFFGVATKKYVGGLIGRYNTVQVLGMREPAPLKNLYVRAQIVEEISAYKWVRLEALVSFFDFVDRVFTKKRETVDGEIIFNKLRKFIVLGKPGAGKTTYLKYLTLMMLDKHSRIRRRKFPIFVTLRAWADESMPLMDFIAQEFDICGFPEAKTFVEKLLKSGDCLVLFDGLDEVSETVKQDEIIRQIKKFADKYSENQFVISCRVAAYNHEFEGFTVVEMADFNQEQMETFIRNWFHGEPKVASECWQRLQNSPPLRELASVPLLLTLLCLEYGESNDFPPNRSDLYHRAIETLLTKWDTTRRIRRPEVYKKLSIRQKESMFARIAIGTFIENQYFIQERDLTRMIEKFIEHLPGFKEEELEPDSKVILKAIEAQHGIFVERFKGVYSFAHLTFQEYFTAKYITDNARESTLEKLVEEHLYDSKWKEVFLLTAGLLDSADELLLLMRRRTNELLEVSEINTLMEVVEKSLLSLQNKYPTVLWRFWATLIVIARIRSRIRVHKIAQALARIYAFDRPYSRTNIDDYIKAYIRVSTLDRTHIFPFGSILAQALNLDHNIHFYSIVDLERAIDLDLLEVYGKANKLDEQIAVKIQNYFSANTLIIHCLEAANYVSKDVREKMLHEICLPKRG